MTLEEFIRKIKASDTVGFAQTMAVIAANYHYRPCTFNNGLNADVLVNQAGSNEGSCKIFAFARIHQLTETQTLNLFGDYYREDVLSDPDGNGHQNIRNFMKYGWDGISFAGTVLSQKH